MGLMGLGDCGQETKCREISGTGQGLTLDCVLHGEGRGRGGADATSSRLPGGSVAGEAEQEKPSPIPRQLLHALTHSPAHSLVS